MNLLKFVCQSRDLNFFAAPGRCDYLPGERFLKSSSSAGLLGSLAKLCKGLSFSFLVSGRVNTAFTEQCLLNSHRAQISKQPNAAYVTFFF